MKNYRQILGDNHAHNLERRLAKARLQESLAKPPQIRRAIGSVACQIGTVIIMILNAERKEQNFMPWLALL